MVKTKDKNARNKCLDIVRNTCNRSRSGSRSRSNRISLESISEPSIDQICNANINASTANDNLDLDDLTDCENDQNLYQNQKFKNRKKSKYQPVRHEFEIKNNCAECKICKNLIKISRGSDGNMRTHLYYIHKDKYDENVLTQSQKEKMLKIGSGEKYPKIDRNEKSKLDEIVLDCIIKDSRTFNDFNKVGMLKLLGVIKPGYKPPSRKSIARRLKKKLI